MEDCSPVSRYYTKRAWRYLASSITLVSSWPLWLFATTEILGDVDHYYHTCQIISCIKKLIVNQSSVSRLWRCSIKPITELERNTQLNKELEHNTIPQTDQYQRYRPSIAVAQEIANDQAATAISRSRSVNPFSSVFSSVVFSLNGQVMPWERDGRHELPKRRLKVNIGHLRHLGCWWAL